MLKFEDIPPLDIFYSPKHRAVVKRQRRKRKLDHNLLSSFQAELMDVVWKNSKVDPSDDLKKLSQYAGAYTTAIIDKASEVNLLIKEKDQIIMQLEQQLVEERQQNEELREQLNSERQKLDQQAIQKQQQLTQEVNKLQTLFQREKVAKEEHNAILQAKLQRFKDYPEVDQFKKEALESNKTLSLQLDILSQKITMVDPLCEITMSLAEKTTNSRLEFEDVDEKISEFLTWQETDQGIAANLPKIQEADK